MSNEALPGVLGNREIRPFISGEQGNKSLKLKATGEQMQFWGTGNIENQDFDLAEQGKMPNVLGEQGNRYPHHHLEGLSNAKADHNINAHIKFGENPLRLYSSHCPESKIWMSCGKITPSKKDEILPLAIPKQMSTISMRTPSLAKIHCYLVNVSSRNKNTDVTLSKIDEICLSAIPKHIFKTSMHTPILVKIHRYLLKLSSGNENTDGRTYDRRTDGRTDTWTSNVIP